MLYGISILLFILSILFINTMIPVFAILFLIVCLLNMILSIVNYRKNKLKVNLLLLIIAILLFLVVLLIGLPLFTLV